MLFIFYNLSSFLQIIFKPLKTNSSYSITLKLFKKNLKVDCIESFRKIFFCVGVMYSGEYDACDVTLSVYPHWASLKNMPDHGGNRTYDLWNTSPMLCQLSYAVWSVRVCDISEQNLVPSISM